MGLFRRRKENRDLISIGSTNPELIRLFGGFGPTLSGVEVTEVSALRQMAVWRAVHLTSSTVASLPLKVYRDENGRRVPVETTLFSDPVYPDMTWFEAIETLVASLLVWGNGYALKVFNERGTRVAQLLPLDPAQVGVRRVDPTEDNPSGKVYQLSGDVLLTPREVLQIPGLSYDGLAGLSPIGFAREAIGVGMAAEQVAAKMFDSGLLAGGYLQADSDMTDEQAEQARERWRQTREGATKAYDVALLSRGWTFHNAQLPPEDAQWLESRHFSVAEIGRLFGIPPALLFEYMDTGNIEADKLGAQWLRFGLNETLRRVESRLSMHLLPRGQFCEFERGGLLQGTPKEQAEVEAIQIASGVLTVNEARALHNRPPVAQPKPVAPPPADEDDEDDEDEPDAEEAGRSFRSLVLRQEPQVINLAAPPAPIVNVTVDPTPVTVEAPNVTVEAPTVNVEAPNVNVEAPNVNVEAPNVNVTPEILLAMEEPDRKVSFERDRNGLITSATIEDDDG